ncbi:MAG TPA: hypothetical protein VMI93_10670 [Candidatus Solibacter sp.]|nr:hypothetical protein [Candidatus Solibacter sp.]
MDFEKRKSVAAKKGDGTLKRASAKKSGVQPAYAKVLAGMHEIKETGRFRG